MYRASAGATRSCRGSTWRRAGSCTSRASTCSGPSSTRSLRTSRGTCSASDRSTRASRCGTNARWRPPRACRWPPSTRSWPRAAEPSTLAGRGPTRARRAGHWPGSRRCSRGAAHGEWTTTSSGSTGCSGASRSTYKSNANIIVLHWYNALVE